MDNFIEINQPEKCTGCYNCVKTCFPKAIKIDTIKNTVDINSDLCTQCGFCTKVCHSNILDFTNSSSKLESILNSNKKVHIILDALVQAEFKDTSLYQLEQALLKLGFDKIHSVYDGFAIHDYITYEHFKETNNTVIKSFCTPFIDYIEKFHPQLIESLSPANTPENISSRLIKEEFGTDVITVYLTTCSSNFYSGNEFDCDMYIFPSDIFSLLDKHNIQVTNLKNKEYKKTAYKFNIGEDNEPAYGINESVDVLNAIQKESTIKKIVTPYWCNDCFGSPIFKNNLTTIERKLLYKKYKIEYYNFVTLTKSTIKKLGDLNRFKVIHKENPIEVKHYSEEEIENTLSLFGRVTEKDRFNCGACGYPTCNKLAEAVLNNVASPEQCTPNLQIQLKNAVDDLNKAYKELDSAFALTIPNSKLEIKLKNTIEYQDIYLRETGTIKITGVIENGGYRHVVNALKIAADLHSRGVMSVIGFDKDTIVKTIIFHDIGKSQPKLEVGQIISPANFFENGKLHAERSAELALANYKNEGITDDVYLLIKYHHHAENELPSDFPEHLLPMYRLFRIIDGISAGLTRRNSVVHFDLIGSTLYIKEFSQHPNYRCFYSLDLYKPEYLKKNYEFRDSLETVLYSNKYK